MKEESIILFHFTNRNIIELILSSLIIKVGKYIKNGKEVIGAVSLTTDANPDGHGLADGREISIAQVRSLKYATEENGRYYSVDNTESCIKLILPKSKVTSASNMHTKPELEALTVMGHLALTPSPTTEQLLSVSRDIHLGTLQAKSATWWYHVCDLPLTNFDFLHKNVDGSYSPLGLAHN